MHFKSPQMNQGYIFYCFRSTHLVEVQERELYEKGITLDKSQPGHFVSVFNKQHKMSKQLSTYAYATLQASSLLSKQ